MTETDGAHVDAHEPNTSEQQRTDSDGEPAARDHVEAAMACVVADPMHAKYHLRQAHSKLGGAGRIPFGSSGSRVVTKRQPPDPLDVAALATALLTFLLGPALVFYATGTAALVVVLALIGPAGVVAMYEAGFIARLKRGIWW